MPPFVRRLFFVTLGLWVCFSLFLIATDARAASSLIECSGDGYEYTCVVTAGNTTTDIYPTWCRSDFRGEYTCDGSTEGTEWGYFDSATCSGSGSVDGCSGGYCGCTGSSLNDTATFVVTLPEDNAPDEYFAIFTDWDAVNILSSDLQFPVVSSVWTLNDPVDYMDALAIVGYGGAIAVFFYTAFSKRK